MNKNIYTALAALSLTISAMAEDVKFSELPNAAQRTINRNLYGGVVHEEGPPDRIFGNPEHERTRAFLKRIIEAGRL